MIDSAVAANGPRCAVVVTLDPGSGRRAPATGPVCEATSSPRLIQGDGDCQRRLLGRAENMLSL